MSQHYEPPVDVNGLQKIKHIPEINVNEIRWYILANRPVYDENGCEILWPSLRVKLWKDHRQKAREYTVHGAGIRVPPPEYILIDNRDAKPGFYGPVAQDFTDRDISVPWQWDPQFTPPDGKAFLNYFTVREWAGDPQLRRDCGLPPWQPEDDEWLSDHTNFMFSIDEEGATIYGLHIHCLPDAKLMIKRNVERMLAGLQQHNEYALSRRK